MVAGSGGGGVCISLGALSSGLSRGKCASQESRSLLTSRLTSPLTVFSTVTAASWGKVTHYSGGKYWLAETAMQG